MIAERKPFDASIAPLRPTTTDRIGAMPAARACVDAIRQEIGSLEAVELIGALERLHRAYREFPELELERPRRDIAEEFRSAAAKLSDPASIPLLILVVAFAPADLSSVMSLLEKIDKPESWEAILAIWNSLYPPGNYPWCSSEPIMELLRQPGNEETVPRIFLELLKHLKLAGEEVTADFGDGLVQLLGVRHPSVIGDSAQATVAPAARAVPSQPRPGGNNQASRDLLLAMARRLRVARAPQRRDHQHDLAWPSGRLSFDEFLMQWPCEVEVPADLDDRMFIGAAYQAVLVREPSEAEESQYLRLLQSGAVSKPWIIEDLLVCAEFRSLERRLRVIWGDCAITEPGRPEAENMPAVRWPWRPAP